MFFVARKASFLWTHGRSGGCAYYLITWFATVPPAVKAARVLGSVYSLAVIAKIVPNDERKYHLTISSTIIDKLGVKLYDKAADVISELVANSYDADATTVEVTTPLGEFLATKRNETVTSKDLKIVVEDNGHGFSDAQANDFYLKVGVDRRKDPARGKNPNKSRELCRLVMGRKGIGKLAAFGICKTIEVWSASGEKGQKSYPVSNFILDYDDIMARGTDSVYNPPIGTDDGKTVSERGTKITLSNFLYKKIPKRDTFMRQLSRKFGIGSEDFQILVTDLATAETLPVSEMHADLMDGTKISVDERPVLLDGKHLQVRGWIAYAKQSYRYEEIAGVRIYARGKLAATARDFGHKAGFTGEFTVRTYMIGVVHADWLDEDDDLIASDRQDILWSSEKGQALQEWGQRLMKELGTKSFEPMRRKSFEIFKERSNLELRAKERFGDTSIYDAAMDVGKRLASGFSEANLEDEDYVKDLLNLILAIAPHKTIVDKLRQLADEGNKNALGMMADLFGDAKIAEIASLGQVAEERIRAIDTLEASIKRGSEVSEPELQLLLQNAPWLISPRWTVLQANQTFDTFRTMFEVWYKEKTGEEITTVAVEDEARRPDFIMLSIERKIEIVEIKKFRHKLNSGEFERLYKYIELAREYLDKNKEYREHFSGVHATLICDDVNLKGTFKHSYESLLKEKNLQHITWKDFLLTTKQEHEAFLDARNATLRESHDASLQ